MQNEPTIQQEIPSFEEKKRWIKTALEPCKLNAVQTAIVEANMLQLMLQMDSYILDVKRYSQMWEKFGKAFDKVELASWSSPDDRNRANALIIATLLKP